MNESESFLALMHASNTGNIRLETRVCGALPISRVQENSRTNCEFVQVRKHATLDGPEAGRDPSFLAFAVFPGKRRPDRESCQ